MLNTKALAASVSAAPAVYVEDVMSVFLYTGTGSTQTITNGIDLAGEGGLVWTKGRSNASSHWLFDTERGVEQTLFTNETSASTSISSSLTAFNSNGFTVGTQSTINGSGRTLASWTFRKAAKFFDVVTYTGNGSNRTISHNLGSVPGCIIVKRTDTPGDWQVYHRANTAAPETDYLVLNSTAATADSNTRWNDTLPTSTVFSLGTEATVNASGGTYVAYLFAHDAGGFGDAGTESVVKCGSFTTDGSGGASVNLGWEPQWVLVKGSSVSGNWFLFDSMRGLIASPGTTSKYLLPNSAGAENSFGAVFEANATGFQIGPTLDPSASFIYIAIRRGPMKTPTSGTEVFATSATTNDGSAITTNFPVDAFIESARAGATNNSYVVNRLTGNTKYLSTANTNAEASWSGAYLDSNTTVTPRLQGSGPSVVVQSFRRAPGFFDVVAYTGNGVSGRTVSHNLGVTPELLIIKRRSSVREWGVASSELTNWSKYLQLNSTAAEATYSLLASPYVSSSSITLGDGGTSNENTETFIAYLFASAPGVSKVGSYTGTGTTLDIDCGFTAGARFVLIKRTDSTGDWFIWDTARGIISGDDPYLLLNSTAAEVTNTDYIDPLSSGFQISSTAPAAINANGGSFIFLAIA
jgi:hypothetical protein